MLTYSITLALIISLSPLLIGQELTKEEKRAQKKAARGLIKSSKELIVDEKFEEAILKLDSLLSFDVKNADGYYYRGLVSLKQQDTLTAETTLDMGISKAPMSSRLKTLRAEIYIKQNKLDEANALLDAVLRIKPKEIKSLYLKGLIFLIQADTAQALEYFDKSLGYGLTDE